jgi:hypothetical protein
MAADGPFFLVDEVAESIFEREKIQYLRKFKAKIGFRLDNINVIPIPSWVTSTSYWRHNNFLKIFGLENGIKDSRAGRLKDDRSLLRGLKLVFVKRDMGQTNEQQRRFNEWPIRELLGEVDSIQTV